MHNIAIKQLYLVRNVFKVKIKTSKKLYTIINFLVYINFTLDLDMITYIMIFI